MSEATQTSPDYGRRDGGGGAAAVVTDASAVSVGMTEGRGRGLFASKAMAKGDTVLIERPLVAMQSLDNAQDVMVCRNCLGFAGDVTSQLELSSGIPRHECLERYERRCSSKEPVLTESGGFSGVHDCLQGCGEVYCSTKCRTAHFERCHRLLCVGPVPEEQAHTHPLVEFRVHAMRTNEIFLLVGEVLTQVVSAFVRTDGDLTDAEAPFIDFVQEPWWEVAVSRETEEGGDPASSTASLHDTLRALCEESSGFLRRALTLPPALETIFTAERFGRVVGMFEQNNVGIRSPSPVLAVLQEVVAKGEESFAVKELAALLNSIEVDLHSDDDSDCNEEEKGACCGQDLETGVMSDGLVDVDEVVDDPLSVLKAAVENYDIDSLFAPLDGTALYSLICCMNHSCRPNCVVRYPGRRSSHQGVEADPLVAQVSLLEDVEAGEELTQSYVDKNMDLLERRSALEDYGFVCRCVRCVEEEQETA